MLSRVSSAVVMLGVRRSISGISERGKFGGGFQDTNDSSNNVELSEDRPMSNGERLYWRSLWPTFMVRPPYIARGLTSSLTLIHSPTSASFLSSNFFSVVNVSFLQWDGDH